MQHLIRNTDARETDLYTALIQHADAEMKKQHKWLCDRQVQIRDCAVSRERTGPERLSAFNLAQPAYTRILMWGLEVSWFKHGTGDLRFNDICDHLGFDIKTARQRRERYFGLPFSPGYILDKLDIIYGPRVARRRLPGSSG